MEGEIKNITFDKHEMTLHFADGRKFTTLLAWYPRLLYASAKQRKHWEMLGKNRGIHWPEIDEDLSIEGLLQGRPSVEFRHSSSPAPTGKRPAAEHRADL